MAIEACFYSSDTEFQDTCEAHTLAVISPGAVAAFHDLSGPKIETIQVTCNQADTGGHVFRTAEAIDLDDDRAEIVPVFGDQIYRIELMGMYLCGIALQDGRMGHLALIHSPGNGLA